MTVVVCLLFLIPATIAAVYYVVLTSIGWRLTDRPADGSSKTRFAILIPAHNEDRVLAETMRAVAASRYPNRLIRTLVIADNCTDDTVVVAQQTGSDVLIRNDAETRGKGYALAFGLPYALAVDVDAVLVLDADCRLDPDALSELDRSLTDGADVVQAAVTMGDPESGPVGLVMAVGSEIENAVQAGLGRLGGTVRLRGTGMAFRRDVLERHPWRSFGKAEDAEYSAILRQAGVRVTFVPTAGLRNTPPTDTAGLCQQRRRWRDALFTDAAGPFDRLLTSKPLILAQLAVTSMVVGLMSLLNPGAVALAFVVWTSTLIAGTVAVYLQAAARTGATPRAMFGLWRTPAVVGRLAWVTAGGLARRGGAWERTPRAANA